MIEKVNALSGEARQSAEEMARLNALKAELEDAIATRARELDQVNQRFIRALKDTGVSMAEQDRDLRYLWVHNSPHGVKRVEFLGRLQSEVLPPEWEPQIALAKRRAMAEGVAVSIDIQTTIDGKPRWFNERIEPLSRDGEITGVMTTSIDTTAYRRQEEHLRSLLRELTHRTKNLLAVIQGIARQSGRSSTNIETYVAQFSGRIRALSITHELLVSSSWRGVDLGELLDAVWRASAPLTAQRVHLSGAAWRLAPESAQHLALAFHEMTNAVERGRPGAGAGDVRIHWAPDDGHEVPGVTLLWEICAGAPNASLKLDEFGRSFIETMLPRATGGASELCPTEAGLRWTLKLPPQNFIS
jgi:PAS domain S-box-containing protein